MLFYTKMIYILVNNQYKTKENHNNYVYKINKNNQNVTPHKKIKIGVIKVRKKKELIFKFSENLNWQTPKQRKF